MLTVKKEGVVLTKTLLEFENEGVLNPAAIREGDNVHLFYRAVSQGNFSSIGYCLLSGPLTVTERLTRPVLIPEFAYELHGVEDPRLVKIEDLYYLTYTAYDGINALGALAISSDLVHWDKQGIIVPQVTYDQFISFAQPGITSSPKYSRYNHHYKINQLEENTLMLWDKNLIFFPRKISGKFCFLHRIKPDIQIVVAVNAITDLTPLFWQSYFLHIDDYVLLSPRFEHEASYVGGGCPPIETEHGWLIIYHGVRDDVSGYVYAACAALLDLNNPQKEIARLPYPLFIPTFSWELKGEVNNVCFPTGAAVFDDTLYIYYGAADERIACASMSLSELMNELLLNPTHHAT
ncbi:MAG: pesticidal protein Cry7Aa [Bacteroidota bacterium]